MTTLTTPLATSASRRPLRSVLAVLAGLFFIFVTSTATDAVMHATGVFPPMDAPPMSSALFLVAFAYRFVFDVAGTALTARLAPSRPHRHAWILGGIGFVASVAGAIAFWDAGPRWYPIALAISVLPCTWLGARLGARR